MEKDARISVVVGETHRIFCDEAIDTFIQQLLLLEPPYEIRVSPINELATGGQKRLWAIWMNQLADHTGESRGELERGFLEKFGASHEFEGSRGLEARPKAFAELTKKEATHVMNQTQALAATIDFFLTSNE